MEVFYIFCGGWPSRVNILGLRVSFMVPQLWRAGVAPVHFTFATHLSCPQSSFPVVQADGFNPLFWLVSMLISYLAFWSEVLRKKGLCCLLNAVIFWKPFAIWVPPLTDEATNTIICNFPDLHTPFLHLCKGVITVSRLFSLAKLFCILCMRWKNVLINISGQKSWTVIIMVPQAIKCED